jgi:hypothetical protein
MMVLHGLALGHAQHLLHRDSAAPEGRESVPKKLRNVSERRLPSRRRRSGFGALIVQVAGRMF